MANKDIRSTELVNKKELHDILDPFCRVNIIYAKLSQDFKNKDLNTPLRDILPGSWPKLQDLQNLYDFAIKHGYKIK